MIDGHIHIERGSYTLEWIQQFVRTAMERGIDEIYLLEHSHRFREFAGVYEVIARNHPYQKEWLGRKMGLSLDEYKKFILELRRYEFPVKLRYGLEVCYVEGCESEIGKLISDFDWDFVTGSVHWIDGWGFDHRKEFWEGRDVDKLYERYYAIMEKLILSGLFTTVAHPDSIKCFGHRTARDLTQTYEQLAELLNAHGMMAEQSAGLKINYGVDEPGMNRKMLEVFLRKGVRLLPASDAHRPEDVGRFVKEMSLCSQ